MTMRCNGFSAKKDVALSVTNLYCGTACMILSSNVEKRNKDHAMVPLIYTVAARAEITASIGNDNECLVLDIVQKKVLVFLKIERAQFEYQSLIGYFTFATIRGNLARLVIFLTGQL